MFSAPLNALAGARRAAEGLVLALLCCLDLNGSEPAPGFLWVTKAGNSGVNSFSKPTGLALDSTGAPFITGQFYGAVTLGTNLLVSTSTNIWPYVDGFLARCDADGRYLWARQINSLNSDSRFRPLVVDKNQNSVVAGTFVGSIDFGATNLVTGPGGLVGEIFLAKYNSVGDLLWARTAGEFSGNFSPVPSVKLSLAQDSAGNLYLAGDFTGTLSVDQTNVLNASSQDAFLLKYGAEGNFLWARSAGGPDRDECWGVTTDPAGNVIIAGIFFNQMDVLGTHLAGVGGSDGYVAEFDARGDLLWAHRVGGALDDHATAVATDGAGNVFLGGEFLGVADVGGLTLTNSAVGAGDDFVVKYDPAGKVIWARQIAGNPVQFPQGLAIDAQDSCYLVGPLTGAVAVFGVATLYSPQPDDYYVAKFLSDGTALWAFKGSNTSSAMIAVSGSGSAYVAGQSGPGLLLAKLATNSAPRRRPFFGNRRRVSWCIRAVMGPFPCWRLALNR